jgi:hypothetical protein
VSLLRSTNRVFPPGITFAIGGAPNERIFFGSEDFAHGAAYVYRRDPTAVPSERWGLDARLVPDGVDSEDNTGSAVALAADAEGTVWAAAWSDHYLVVWRRDGPPDGPGTWTEETRFDVGGYAFGFGRTYYAGSAPALGRTAARFAGPTGDGFVRVWRHDEGGAPPWVEEAALVPSADGPQDAFGASVALDGDLLVVGSKHVASGFPPGGRAYVFRYTGAGPFGGWEEEAVLEPAVSRRVFGEYVSVEADPDGYDTAVIHSGVPTSEGSSAHVFRRDAATGLWHEVVVVGPETGLDGWVRGVGSGFAVSGDQSDGTLGSNAGMGYLVDLRGVLTAAEPGPEPSDGLSVAVAPSPVRRQGTVVVTVQRAGRVSVGLYDVLGRRAAVVHEGALGAGTHRLPFDARRIPAGVYVVRVTTAEGTASVTVPVVR